MKDKINIKLHLESEHKYLSFLIKNGDAKNKSLREELLKRTVQELDNINNYLMINCCHEIIKDYTPKGEEEVMIKYCNNCGLTLR